MKTAAETNSKIMSFYASPEWENMKKIIVHEYGGVCVLCLQQGRITKAEVVHHVIPLTEESAANKDLALNKANLIPLCNEHHEEMHRRITHLPVRFE